MATHTSSGDTQQPVESLTEFMLSTFNEMLAILDNSNRRQVQSTNKLKAEMEAFKLQRNGLKMKLEKNTTSSTFQWKMLDVRHNLVDVPMEESLSLEQIKLDYNHNEQIDAITEENLQSVAAQGTDLAEVRHQIKASSFQFNDEPGSVAAQEIKIKSSSCNHLFGDSRREMCSPEQAYQDHNKVEEIMDSYKLKIDNGKNTSSTIDGASDSDIVAVDGAAAQEIEMNFGSFLFNNEPQSFATQETETKLNSVRFNEESHSIAAQEIEIQISKNSSSTIGGGSDSDIEDVVQADKTPLREIGKTSVTIFEEITFSPMNLELPDSSYFLRFSSYSHGSPKHKCAAVKITSLKEGDESATHKIKEPKHRTERVFRIFEERFQRFAAGNIRIPNLVVKVYFGRDDLIHVNGCC